MSISTNLQANAALRGQENLGPSLTRIAANSTKPGAFDAIAVSGKLDTQRQGTQSALDSVQGAVSAAQTQAGILGLAAGILGKMASVQDASQATGNPAFQQKFEALQEQLQATTGGTDSVGDSRSGATLAALVAQDNPGTYRLELSSAETSGAIAGAIQAVKEERAGLGETLAGLNRHAAGLQVEFANLNASLPGPQNSAEASAATQWARHVLSTQPGTAQAAQSSGRAPQAAFKLLED